jgi:hypothetical protein
MTNALPVWIYDGIPEHVDLNVVATTSVEGGYVLAMQLSNDTIRLAATRHPSKYITAWRYNVRRYSVPDVVRVLVSKPHLRYEAVKRGLAGKLSECKDADSDVYLLEVDALTQKAQEVFEAAGIANEH